MPNQARSSSTDCPPIVQFGLIHTLNWILGKINQINDLADNFARQVPPLVLNDIRSKVLNDRAAQDEPSIMKRPFDANSGDPFKTRNEAVQAKSESKSHNKRRSLTGDELPPVRTPSEFHPHLHGTRDSRGDASHSIQPLSRSPIISPASPTITRQLPSPPERPFPSPTSFNLPSPSGPISGTAPQASHRLLPHVAHQSAINQYLPPVAATHLSDSALRDHSATLQHEVSVQKLKLSSLQGEHDKLLAAFQRSQARASALEKKHAVSDAEINSLTEDKQRLQQQINDLERDIEELSRSREDCRHTAVQEGSQYIKIVERATRLENIAIQERRTWDILKEDMERRIEALVGDKSRGKSLIVSTESITGLVSIEDGSIEHQPPTSTHNPFEQKSEVTSELHQPAPIPHPPPVPQESIDELKAEIHRLRVHCTEIEGALRSIRDMGRALAEQADAALHR